MGLEPMLHACIGVSGVEKRSLGFSGTLQTGGTAVPWQLHAHRDVFTQRVYPGSIQELTQIGLHCSSMPRGEALRYQMAAATGSPDRQTDTAA